MVLFKACVGIDISKTSFTACVCQVDSTDDLSFSKVATFTNDKKGFNQLIRWIQKNIDVDQPLLFLMEATGVYYENLAHHLHKIKKSVCIVLPNTSKHYFSSLNIKTKTDEIDAKILSQFGVERRHRLWTPPAPIYLELRNLTRFYVQLNEQKTALNNIKHSKECAHDVQQFILTGNKQIIAQINKQITKCKSKIEELVTTHSELQEKVKKLMTIKGVGFLTIATILAETFGFEHFKSAKQLASYAGYDVVQRESGTSVKGKTRISKKGNRYIRNALYFPGMVACRHNQELKQQYLRIITRKPSKMVGQVAIQRKLLLLIYTLWKNDTVYIENYKKQVAPIEQAIEATQDNSETELLSQV